MRAFPDCVPGRERLPLCRWVREFLRHYLGGLYDRIGRHHVLFFAGGLSFSIFICVIPFGLILFSVLGIVIERSSLETQVVAFIDGMVPYPAYASFVKGVVLSRIGDFIAHRRLAGYLGVAGLVLAASSLFASMRCVLNTVYEVEEGKNPVVGKLRDLGMILLVLLFFLVAAEIGQLYRERWRGIGEVRDSWAI